MNINIVKSFVVALVATLAIPLISTSLMAQETGGVVVVLDVAKVFKANTSFDTQMEQIKTEANALQVKVQGQQQSIQERAQQVSEMEANTTERNQMEAQLEQEQAALRTQARQSETDLLNREAQAYFATYTEMQRVVASLAAEHNISLVLRYDSEDIDPNNRGEVIKGVNRSIVFHRDLDLTDMVIAGMNPASANAGGDTMQK